MFDAYFKFQMNQNLIQLSETLYQQVKSYLYTYIVIILEATISCVFIKWSLVLSGSQALNPVLFSPFLKITILVKVCEYGHRYNDIMNIYLTK